jgi:hypothetical protein
MPPYAWQQSSGTSYIILFHLGGQIARLPGHHSAAGGREAGHAIVINAVWTDGRPAHPDIEWCRDTFRALQPHATAGVYVNFVDHDEGQARVRAAYGPRYKRLTQIKARSTPTTSSAATRTFHPSPPDVHPIRRNPRTPGAVRSARSAGQPGGPGPDHAQ